MNAGAVMAALLIASPLADEIRRLDAEASQLLDAREYARAAERYERARALMAQLPHTAADQGKALLLIGFCLAKQQRPADAERAYNAALRFARPEEVRSRVEGRLGRLRVSAPPASAPIVAASEASPTANPWAWAATAGAVLFVGTAAATFGAGRARLDEANAAYTRYDASTVAAERADLETEIRSADEDVAVLRAASYGLGAAGIVVAALAIYMWVATGDAPVDGAPLALRW